MKTTTAVFVSSGLYRSSSARRGNRGEQVRAYPRAFLTTTVNNLRYGARRTLTIRVVFPGNLQLAQFSRIENNGLAII
ncbi:hypothetical protein [Burkholderia pyrrocinia]